ncbi:MAG TPA: ribosome maturation factor RimP [Nocardioidaceae bacterium]|nr:ribosome maturation factor RimP [Nocardioidaceae bacterium]
MSATSLPDRVTAVVEPAVTHLGLELEAVELTNAGRRRLLRVVVDTETEMADGVRGVTLDQLAEATREVSRALDDADAMGSQAYTLEVTSPGIDRPLTAPRHWRRNLGRLVKVTPTEGSRQTGRVLRVADASVTLDVDGTEYEWSYADIARATVQVEFNRKDG